MNLSFYYVQFTIGIFIYYRTFEIIVMIAILNLTKFVYLFNIIILNLILELVYNIIKKMVK